MNTFDIEYIKEFIAAHLDSKVYLGVDSQRMKKKKVRFAIVVIIHYNGCNGARVFHDVTYDNIVDAKLGRPFNRMMKEVEMVTNLYNKLEDVLIERDFEIHLDVNPEKGTGSNVAYAAARGMIYGMVGIEPICKPMKDGDKFPWAASCAADRYSK